MTFESRASVDGKLSRVAIKIRLLSHVDVDREKTKSGASGDNGQEQIVLHDEIEGDARTVEDLFYRIKFNCTIKIINYIISY